MTSARRGPRRYTELVHQLEDGAREALGPGCWAVVGSRDLEQPLTMAQVAAGPHHQHLDGETIAAYWQLHDGSWRRADELTRLDLAGVLEEGTMALAATSRGRSPDRSAEAVLRVHRSACLARRALSSIPADLAPDLEALVQLDIALSGIDQAWREMVRVRLPNLARSIAVAGALELARRPVLADLAQTIRRALSLHTSLAIQVEMARQMAEDHAQQDMDLAFHRHGHRITVARVAELEREVEELRHADGKPGANNPIWEDIGR